MCVSFTIDGVVYLEKGSSDNVLRVRHIEGHCNDIPKGTVRVGFWIGNCNGMGTLMATQDGIQYPGSLLKKFLKHKLKRDSKD